MNKTQNIMLLVAFSLFATINAQQDILNTIEKTTCSIDNVTSFTELGKQYVLDLYDCDPRLIEDVANVETILLDAATKAKATIITHNFHKFPILDGFEVSGVSGAIIISESHFAIHTWPELGYCAVDIFTCGTLDIDKAFEIIKAGFAAKNYNFVQVKRGLAATDKPTGNS